MKDPTGALQTAYYTALSALSTPVYDRVPEGTDYPYIKLGDHTMIDGSSKSEYTMDTTFTVQIFDGYERNVGGKKRVLEIGDDAIGAIVGKTLDLSPDFRIVTAPRLDYAETLDDHSETHTYYRRVLRFRQLIEQLT
jgi:hypothetical protein